MKTTALRMINRMLLKRQRQIEIDGKDVRNMNPVELRQALVMLFNNWVKTTTIKEVDRICTQIVEMD